MTTVTAQITGSNFINLDMVRICGIKYASKTKIKDGLLTATWICENENYESALQECMDCLNLYEVENWGCELESFA